MNKTAIKNYAVDARKKWIQAITQQAEFYGCTENTILDNETLSRQLADKGVFLTAKEKDSRNDLVKDINNKDYQNTIEEVAYTWFNRLIAIRFMEVNGYLPGSIRILSSADSERIEPDCVREYARLDFIEQDIAEALAAQSEDKLYRYILVEQCKKLGEIMPKMFTHLSGYAALLLPERLYIKGGLVHDLTHAISEEDFGEQVEIIGWLYQYYISEKKDQVFADLKKNVKITRENIPAATQLFTPDWIVKYMVENSLGRLWLEQHPDSKLRSGWKYYLDEAEQTPEVDEQLRALVEQNPINSPEEIRLIDPCMGSGHILVYAFDVLFQIYQSVGYADRDIPDLILEHNIYGLDIDERACQLAYFALMMKARSYNRRFFRRENVPQPQVYSPQGYEEGMEYGSLLKVDELEDKPIEKTVYTLFDVPYDQELNTWNFRRLLHQKYDIVVTNPPYMGSKGMSGKLAEHVKKNYPASKADMFAVFIEKCGEMLNDNGYQAMITQHAWMFLSSYEKLRAKLMHRSIINMAHLGSRAFEEIGGEVVQTTAFVMARAHIKKYKATYVRLVDFNSQQAKEEAFLTARNRHISTQENFEKIPNLTFAYWVGRNTLRLFELNQMRDFGDSCIGMRTGDNGRFLRLWTEVDYTKMGLHFENSINAQVSGLKWFPYCKGGSFRKWFGNNDYVVNWQNDGYEIKENTRNVYPYLGDNLGWKISNEQYYFIPGLTWSGVGASIFGVRSYSYGMIFDSGANSFFVKDRNYYLYFAALLNSKLINMVIKIINPTINTGCGVVASLPAILDKSKIPEINDITKNCIYISKVDWDSFETSWDFETHPLVHHKDALYVRDIRQKPQGYMYASYEAWEHEAEMRFNTLKSNEEELNRIFIDIYGLQDELTPEVEEKDVTVRRADLSRDIRSFVSYAVGCMFGRYSLDTPGLAYAGGQWDESKYSSFIPDAQNIIPITDADYFDDDIVMRFVDFVKVVYGEDTLAENLEFIAKALYPNGTGTAREIIRRYFQNDFFKDHCKIYQKRPIYWLFDSGRQNGFKALIYLHRYDKYTVARVRTEYLHPLQRKYDAEIERMKNLTLLPETSARDKAAFKKQTEKISKQIAECRAYDQIISHIASQSIELDLDDGVKVNYAKFQNVEVPSDDDKSVAKMNLLAKI